MALAGGAFEDEDIDGFTALGDSLVKLEMPDLPPDFGLELGLVDDGASVPLPPRPASCANLPDGLFQSLCSRMMENIHRNHSMTEEEKEATLRKVVLPIPGEPAGRQLHLLEDHTGVYSAGSTGSVLWPAALGLIRLLDRKVANSSSGSTSAVELGAGLGAVGLFLSVHKGARVVLTDIPDSLPLLRRNVQECTGAALPRVCLAEVKPLLWGRAEHLAQLGTYDWVVGSDITYRPECLGDLLLTASKLLAPSGRLVLTLQDRPGEKSRLEAACDCASSPLELTRCDAMEIKENAVNFDQDTDGDDVRIWVCEFGRKGGWKPPKKAQPALFADDADLPAGGAGSISTPEDVEAEFERITGVRPEKLIPEGFKRTAVSREVKEAPPRQNGGGSKTAKTSIVKDMLDRGLGDYLCQLDEDLRARINRYPADVRPRTTRQKQAFAKAYYAGEEPPPEAFDSGGASIDRLEVDPEEDGHIGEAYAEAAVVAAGAAQRSAPDEGPPDAATAPPEAAAAEAEPEDGADVADVGEPRRLGRARLCLPGLDWVVEIKEAAACLTATVTFGERIWITLQGALQYYIDPESSQAFRDAVDFELAERELRVLHAGTTVLELELPRSVSPSAAQAKICSKRRRVTVRAPLADR